MLIVLGVGLLLQILILFELRSLMSSSTQGLTDLQNAVSALTTLATTVLTAIQSLQAQIAELQAQLAAGTEVTDAQLETMAQTLEAAESSITAALPTPPVAPSSAQVKKS
jgi:hypothetical protein